jgi:hypothetical protein
MGWRYILMRRRCILMRRMISTVMAISVLTGLVVAPLAARVAFLPIKDARCVRKAHPPGTPISGCYLQQVGNIGFLCAGNCYQHRQTLFFGVCENSRGSTCHAFMRSIRVIGSIAPCQAVFIGGRPNCKCGPWTPYTGHADVVDCN